MTGILLLLAGAVCGGSFGLPSKFVKKDTPWETLWGPFFFFVSVLIPTLIFPVIAKDLFKTCAEVGFDVIIWPIAFGFLWGLGSMTLGMSFSFIGLSLAYAINYGAQIITGGFLGVLSKGIDFSATHGIVIVAGIAICLVGVVFCGRAAILKSQSLGVDENMPKGGKLVKGLIAAFLSGILCACYGLGAGAGAEVVAKWTALGNDGWQSACVVAALILWGGSISACGYCVYKLCKNRSWGTLTASGIGKVFLIALVMAILHDGAIVLYGIGASHLGPLGTAIGYAMFMSFAIMVGNVNGFLSGEWKGASQKAVIWIVSGIVVLMLGVCILERGNNLHGKYLRNQLAEIETN